MQINNFIAECGLNQALSLRDRLLTLGVSDEHRFTIVNGMWMKSSQGFSYNELDSAVKDLQLIELWGGYGRCCFFMKGMQLNQSDGVICPDDKHKAVSRAALEAAINTHKEIHAIKEEMNDEAG